MAPWLHDSWPAFCSGLILPKLSSAWTSEEYGGSKTTDCMSHTLTGVCSLWRWFDNDCGCMYEKETGGVATAAAVQVKKERERKKGRASMSQPDNCSLQVARLPQRKWEVCSWVSAPCVSPEKLCQDPRIASHRQPASACYKKVSFSSSTALPIPKSFLRRKNISILVDGERQQPTYPVVFALFPKIYLHYNWKQSISFIEKLKQMNSDTVKYCDSVFPMPKAAEVDLSIIARCKSELAV